MNYWSNKNQKELEKLMQDKGLLDTYVFLLEIYYKQKFNSLTKEHQWKIRYSIDVLSKKLFDNK